MRFSLGSRAYGISLLPLKLRLPGLDPLLIVLPWVKLPLLMCWIAHRYVEIFVWKVRSH